MARILFLTQVLPFPRDSGAKIRAYYVLRHLVSRHEVTLVSFVRGDDGPEGMAHLGGLCRAVHTVPMRRSRLRDIRALLTAGLTGQSVIIVRDEIGEMRALLRRLVQHESFDVVHADQTSMAQYALDAAPRGARSAMGKRPRLLLDAHNALYRIPHRMAANERNRLKRRLLLREARALRRYEQSVCDRFDHVVFVANQDRDAIRSSGNNDRSSVIPICVDPEQSPMVERVQHPLTITHLGTMFWPPNIEGVLWFAEQVFSHIVADVPGSRLVVAGKNPPEEIRKLGAGDPNIDVVGYVPDPKAILAETAAFIVPLHSAGGMRVKILDAWCWGVPVVSTAIGAEGIALRHGETMLVADNALDFAQAVIRLLTEPELGKRLRRNGRRWVQQYYDWHRVYSEWDSVYQGLNGPP